MFGKKQKADRNKFAKWEKYRISDEEAGTMVGGSLFASYEGVLRLLPYYEDRGIRDELYKDIKYDLQIRDGCISFSGLMAGSNYAFVINSHGELKIGEHFSGMHYALAEGAKYIKAAGTLQLNQSGKILQIANISGHYQPLSSDNDQAFKAFGDHGLLAPGARKINMDFPQHPYGAY